MRLPATAILAGLGVLAGIVAGTLPSMALAQDTGVTSDRILLGQSAAIVGPESAIGLGLMRGMTAAFKEVNEAGGVKGRKIELITYDDGYAPDVALQNTRKLISSDGVFALVGAVGTPATTAAQPIATNFGVPFFGAYSGAAFLRNPKLKNIVNIRASVDEEAEAWVEHLTKDIDAKRIGVLYQEDSFGRAGLEGVRKAMDKRGLKLVAEGSYYRGTTAVKTALLDIRKAKADSVVLIGTAKPVAEFIKLARSLGMESLFVSTSFVGPETLAQDLGAARKGVVVSQAVPNPMDDSLKLAADFRAALKELDASIPPSFIGFEGYITGRLIVDALSRIEGDITRKALLETIATTGTFDLGGVTLNFGAEDNQGLDKVFMTVIQDDGAFKTVNSLAAVGG
ncbi:MAG: ABC transporter substrate-binding protein [Alphaproteobacteria bacterium]|nr:ABC transporter substrate-binding protein [Alphaproteobacteria bacterium]MBU0798696.1 ABC transporter substrate-binding protein [Alphaproteobacteria bacterium]MBU0885959.1 ABC transporter substrate-binding protein [Alphaproteobacteria bacterium]MBU1811948.1 ABC transporter substrate-binding protein [Alphaproteobacteria bacterium]MBU2091842.1 ABC transporter substrate-binding protein [Alphaproteobacteria bacterium]